jgi:hypothetical protein
VKEYCASQSDVAARRIGELKALLQRSLAQGSFLFRGETTAVDSLGSDLLEAAKKHLGPVAEQVFHRYAEAPERVDTAVAEKFLRTGAGNLKAITTQLDPLGLVLVTGGNPSIRTDHKALVSIRDYIDRNGTVDGKRLLEHFSNAPFGWSQDTLRYLVAALLVGADIKLKVSGREVTVAGQQAIDALKTNNAFKPIGVALRQDKPPMEVLARAAQRLTDLIGDTVVPLEEDIGKAAAKHLPQLQQELAPLAEKLSGLELPGAERVRTLTQQIADLLFNDASDAPEHLGGEESALYDGLKWAQAVTKALGHGLQGTIKDLRTHQRAIASLPSSGVPGQLKQDCADDLERLAGRLDHEGFYQHAADLSSILTALHAKVATAAAGMMQAQQERIRDGEQDLKRIPEWAELTQETQNNALDQLAGLALSASNDLAGLQRLISHEFDLSTRLEELKQRIIREGRERQRQRVEEQKKKDVQDGGKAKATRSLPVPLTLSTTAELDALIRRLQALRAELSYYDDFELTLERD